MTVDKKKNKLTKAIVSKLSTDERELFKLIEIQITKNHVTFRMPKGLIKLDSIWEKIIKECELQKFTYKRTGLFATLDELDDIIGDIEWIWHKFLPKGFVTMLAGDPGAGKSAVALDMARCIISNVPFPLDNKSLLKKKSNVIWIDTEASQQLLNIRAKAMNIDRSYIHIPVIDGDILSQITVDSEDHRDQIISLIEYARPELLVLDSLGSSHSKGENKTEDIEPVLKFFALLARDYNIGVLIIHHLRKGKEGESAEVSLYRIRGSTAIPALCRTILALEKPNDDMVVMRMIKSNLIPFKSSEAITIKPLMDETGETIKAFEYSGYTPPEPKKTKKERCAEWVLGILNDKKSIDLKELKEMGEQNIPSFTASMIYASREILGDRVTYNGTGNKAIWKLTEFENDTESINKIKKAIKK